MIRRFFIFLPNAFIFLYSIRLYNHSDNVELKLMVFSIVLAAAITAGMSWVVWGWPFTQKDD